MSGRIFIEEDFRKAVGRKDKHAYLQFDESLDTFELQTLQEMIDSTEVAELKGYELYEYRFKLDRRIARIFFHREDDVAHMLHLFIKKSTRGSKTDNKHVEIAMTRKQSITCLPNV